MKYDIFLEYHWSLNESEKLIFFRNKYIIIVYVYEEEYAKSRRLVEALVGTLLIANLPRDR